MTTTGWNLMTCEKCGQKVDWLNGNWCNKCITEAAEADPDCPPLTEEQLKHMRLIKPIKRKT